VYWLLSIGEILWTLCDRCWLVIHNLHVWHWICSPADRWKCPLVQGSCTRKLRPGGRLVFEGTARGKLILRCGIVFRSNNSVIVLGPVACWEFPSPHVPPAPPRCRSVFLGSLVADVGLRCCVDLPLSGGREHCSEWIAGSVHYRWSGSVGWLATFFSRASGITAVPRVGHVLPADGRPKDGYVKRRPPGLRRVPGGRSSRRWRPAGRTDGPSTDR